MTFTSSARAILATLIAFDTTSRNSNLELIGWVEGYLSEHGVTSTRVVNADASKANLYATVGPHVEGGIILSKAMGEPGGTAQQVHLVHSYIKLLFSPRVQ